MNPDIEKRIRVLEENQTQTIMSNNADMNILRAVMRALTTENLVIGQNDNSSPTISAILSLNSITKGFLLPRMTTTQRNAIVSPATGLVIYNITTDKINFYDNSATWRVVTST